MCVFFTRELPAPRLSRLALRLTQHTRPQEVEKQFALVERHIARLRTLPMHLQRALSGILNVRHRIDHAAKRYGIIMNEEVKYGACTASFQKFVFDRKTLSCSLSPSLCLSICTHTHSS